MTDEPELTTVIGVAWGGQVRGYIAQGDYETFQERMRREKPEVTEINVQYFWVTGGPQPLDEVINCPDNTLWTPGS
jgi:hypothetical protein